MYSCDYDFDDDLFDCDDGVYDSDNSEGGQSINLLMPRVVYRMPFQAKGKLKSYNQVEGYLLLPIITSSGDWEMSDDEKESLQDKGNYEVFWGSLKSPW